MLYLPPKFIFFFKIISQLVCSWLHLCSLECVPWGSFLRGSCPLSKEFHRRRLLQLNAIVMHCVCLESAFSVEFSLWVCLQSFIFSKPKNQRKTNKYIWTGGFASRASVVYLAVTSAWKWVWWLSVVAEHHISKSFLRGFEYTLLCGREARNGVMNKHKNVYV